MTRRTARRLPALLVGLLLVGTAAVSAQDVERIRLGINYTAGARPGILVMAGPGLDSVRRVIERDLGFSDRFEMAFLPDTLGRLARPLDAASLKPLGVAWAVELQRVAAGVEVKLHEVAAGQVRQQGVRALDLAAAGDDRLAIHRVSDEIVGWVTGGIGIAATRILYKGDEAGSRTDTGIWRIDIDGQNPVRVSRATGLVLSPAWNPDGTRIAYTEIRDNVGALVIQSLATGARVTVPTAVSGINNAAAFSPDGSKIVFGRVAEEGTDLYEADVARMCCAHKLTTNGKYAANLTPSYSPDGRRIAFMSTRAGSPQIYGMDADGTDQAVLVPFDGGETGSSYAPDWSPDGSTIAFGRDAAGGRQIFTYQIGSGRPSRQRTSSGRQNEDPSWAPDSRHLVFRSNRTGRDQLWVVDLETGASRQIPTPGGARLPSWSPILRSTNP
ncbi:MAG: hypothetical protein ABJC19_02780 [Gemmatimonadota bacterium]